MLDSVPAVGFLCVAVPTLATLLVGLSGSSAGAARLDLVPDGVSATINVFAEPSGSHGGSRCRDDVPFSIDSREIFCSFTDVSGRSVAVRGFGGMELCGSSVEITARMSATAAESGNFVGRATTNSQTIALVPVFTNAACDSMEVVVNGDLRSEVLNPSMLGATYAGMKVVCIEQDGGRDAVDSGS
ncbi:MAG: hypothetical protein R3E97_23880 [Candidatus Eisenbacteria bacterium]